MPRMDFTHVVFRVKRIEENLTQGKQRLIGNTKSALVHARKVDAPSAIAYFEAAKQQIEKLIEDVKGM